MRGALGWVGVWLVTIGQATAAPGSGRPWAWRVPLDVHKAVPFACPGLALSIPVGFLGLPEDADWHAAWVTDSTGAVLPAQVDDLDGNGRIEGTDALVFVAEVKEAVTRAYVCFPGARGPTRVPPEMHRGVRVRFDRDGVPEFSNGRLRLSNRSYAYRSSGNKTWTQFLDGDGTLDFDAYDFGGSTLSPWKTHIISSGPVRTIARRVSEVAPTRRARRGDIARARVVHEWHVYARRQECLVVSRIENVDTDAKVLKVARARAWLDVKPGGRYTKQDYWTAVVKPLKTWTKSMTAGRKTRRAAEGLVTDLRLAEGWFDAYTDGPQSKPRVNAGLVVHPMSAPCRLWSGDRDGRFRVAVMVDGNWPRVSPRSSLSVGLWIVPHEGGPDEVRRFWQAIRDTQVIPGEVQRRGDPPQERD